MTVKRYKENGEAWGGRYSIERSELEIEPGELVDYLLENGYDEIPDYVDIEVEGEIFEVKCCEVLRRQGKAIKRFHNEKYIGA